MTPAQFHYTDTWLVSTNVHKQIIIVQQQIRTHFNVLCGDLMNSVKSYVHIVQKFSGKWIRALRGRAHYQHTDKCGYITQHCHVSGDKRWNFEWISWRKMEGRGGMVAWPTQSPNLNPSEFFTRGYTKSYTKLPLTHAWKHGMVQVAACVQSNGWHF